MALADSVLLATDDGFRGRVLVAVLAAAVGVLNEAVTPATINAHLARRDFVLKVVENPLAWQTQFALIIASDPSVVQSATDGLAGAPATPTLTTGNLAAQAASIPDSVIATSIVSNFNVFFSY